MLLLILIGVSRETSDNLFPSRSFNEISLIVTSLFMAAIVGALISIKSD